MSNVLIVEDDPMVAFINQKYLERMDNMNIFGPVATLEEILVILEQSSIELILLDAYLPKKNGFEILKILREKQYYMNVIMITAANSNMEVQRAYAYGVVDYLVKPFEISRFELAIKKHFAAMERMLGKEYLRQEDIDRQSQEQCMGELPKGLNRNTLEKVLQKLRENPQCEWSLRELAKEIQISNVTVKKYMDYLEQKGQVDANLTYGQVGRPEYKYLLRI